jgi:hypothetical protein
MTDLIIRSSVDEDDKQCQSIGCRNMVDGASTRCRIHLNIQASHQANYRQRKREKCEEEKMKLTNFDTLLAEKHKLARELQESLQKSKLYDELKQRYDLLKLTYTNNIQRT